MSSATAPKSSLELGWWMAISDGADGMAARAQETAAQFKMFAVYQAHQQEYLGGMMRAIISKPQSDGAINQLVSTGMKTQPDIGVAMLIADMFGVNRTPALKKIDCPTLIITSAKSDELSRQQAAANRIPHARFEKVDDAAHAVFIDQPDRFDELVISFVAKLAATTPHISGCVDRIGAPGGHALTLGCESLTFL